MPDFFYTHIRSATTPRQLVRFLQHLDESTGGKPAPPAPPKRPRRKHKGCFAGVLRSMFHHKPSGWAPADFPRKEHDPFVGHLQPKSEALAATSYLPALDKSTCFNLSSPSALANLRRTHSSAKPGPPEAVGNQLLSRVFFRHVVSKMRASHARVAPELSPSVLAG